MTFSTVQVDPHFFFFSYEVSLHWEGGGGLVPRPPQKKTVFFFFFGRDKNKKCERLVAMNKQFPRTTAVGIQRNVCRENNETTVPDDLGSNPRGT